jgi:lipoprotein-anchoring transpeptidase ErfK/SrfK
MMVNREAKQNKQIPSFRREERRITRQPASNSRLVLISVGLLAGLGILFGLAVAGWWWFTSSENRIQPGVSVAQIHVGGLTPQEAAQKLDQFWNGRSIILTDGTHAWQTSPSFLGLWMDPGATLQQEQILPEAQISWQALVERWNPAEASLLPVVRFDRAVAESQLSHWAELVGQPARDADLRLENGQAIAIPGQAGSALDLQRTLDAIAADPLGTLASKQATVYFTTVPPQVIDVSAGVEQVNAVLNSSLGGTIYDPIKDENIPWQIPHDQLVSWVSLNKGENGFQACLNRDSLVNYLADLPSHVDMGPERVIDAPSDPHGLADRVLAGQAPLIVARYLPTEYTVKSSETLMQVGWKVGMQYWRLEKANPGVNPNALRPGQKLVIPSKSDLLPLPVVPNKRIVINITQQRMWVYENGERIREFVVSTGIANSPTQPGIYQVQTHDVNAYAANWDLYMPHWLGIYEAWPGFMNGIHGLPMLSSGVRLWANVVGKPASYGCIILNLPNAEWLYGWAENGVVVEIQA